MSPEKRPKLPVDIYVRVSRVGGRDVEADGGTAAEQEKRCRAQLEADGLKAGEVFVDLDQSGGKTSRPEFDKAKARIESGVSGGIIVINLSRFGRNRRVDEDILALEEMGGTVISIEDKLDTSTPSGRFALTILSAVNTLYLENVTEAWQRTHVNHIARGVPTGRAPAGYSKTEKGTLTPNEHAPVIVEAFEMRAAGAPVSAVRDLLIERGVPTSGGGVWLERTTQRLLKNPTYTGQIRFGHLVEKNTHEAIIGSVLWARVQATFTEGAPRGKREHALLAGLLQCAKCGGRMTLDSSKRNGQTYRFYRCKSEACSKPKPTIGAAPVEEHIVTSALAHLGNVWGERPAAPSAGHADAVAALDKARADREEVDVLKDAMSPANLALARTEADAAVAAAEIKVAEAEESGALIRWMIPHPDFDLLPEPEYTDEEIAEAKEFTKAAGLEPLLEKIQANVEPGEHVHVPTTAKDAGYDDTRVIFERLPVAQQRQILQGLVEKVTIKPANGSFEGRIGIEWKDAA